MNDLLITLAGCLAYSLLLINTVLLLVAIISVVYFLIEEPENYEGISVFAVVSCLSGTLLVWAILTLRTAWGSRSQQRIIDAMILIDKVYILSIILTIVAVVLVISIWVFVIVFYPFYFKDKRHKKDDDRSGENKLEE